MDISARPVKTLLELTDKDIFAPKKPCARKGTAYARLVEAVHIPKPLIPKWAASYSRSPSIYQASPSNLATPSNSTKPPAPHKPADLHQRLIEVRRLLNAEIETNDERILVTEVDSEPKKIKRQVSFSKDTKF